MNDIKTLINDPETLIVDVRSPWEFDIEHVAGAKNIPLEEISSRIDSFSNHGKPVVLYCRSGNRSGMAVNLLKQSGLQNVYNGGGLSDVQFLLN